ncbi:cytochrome ubiquinol oxidase subunit I [Bacillus aquiflavi]|uniref:Cytochrome c class I n=1 Tax=Bacillus aquiflavi TaxID=2672567 RepID=A0A6B3VXB7_9BACI|nr:cytochrome ubiquinol oxidase subunit I [Bacillus aquiflavi]MBA4538374.1 cytochrome ubiquinol oxidase subunit I [Bacillus aquiflavi]NEY82739.1 cytochrome c class I [Bacillus aquiflavi]UAC49532.1 cytochrome ubiquinol oxidase subunit I [Bacillus aquiflavi]
MWQLGSIIPKDIELVIPGNIGFFEILLVISFLLHILFVNITVGSSSLAVFQEIKGIVKKDKKYDNLAFQLATHASIMKSIAVVIGVAPLLIISVIYTQYFYPSTLLIGKAWLSLIILLIAAFLILYLYKFSWDKMGGGKKKLHVLIGATGSLLLLFVPLIFIVNVVSMLYPEMWEGSKGFFHGLVYYPQIWQRYFHFILASFAVAGFYLYFWNARAERKIADRAGMTKEEKAEVVKDGKKFGVKVMLWTTLLQLVAGTVLLMSFERDIMMLYMGDSALLTGLLIGSIFITLLLSFFLYLLLKHDKRKYFILSMTTFVLVLGLMGWMRHELRESYLEPYKADNVRTTSIEVSE